MDKLNKLLEEYPNGKGDLDSLKFLRGFIKRLVDNDKIDKSLWNAGVELYHTSYDMYEALLMLLAISDTPIEDLCSYLK